MAIKSHIQAPRSVMSRFVDENLQKVHYINVETGYLGLCGAKKIDTELGWYSDETEKQLNDLIENPFSCFCNKIIDYINGEIRELYITEKEDRIIKSYFITSIGRSECIRKSFDMDVWLNELASEKKHDLVVGLSIKMVNGIPSNIDELVFGFYENKSGVGFIFPRNCFYTINDGLAQIIVMPISPKIAIGLFDNQYLSNSNTFMEDRVIIIQDEETVKYMNSHAIQYEIVMNGKFAISSHKEELIEAWEMNKENIEKLFKLRETLSSNMQIL